MPTDIPDDSVEISPTYFWRKTGDAYKPTMISGNVTKIDVCHEIGGQAIYANNQCVQLPGYTFWELMSEASYLIKPKAIKYDKEKYSKAWLVQKRRAELEVDRKKRKSERLRALKGRRLEY